MIQFGKHACEFCLAETDTIKEKGMYVCDGCRELTRRHNNDRQGTR